MLHQVQPLVGELKGKIDVYEIGNLLKKNVVFSNESSLQLKEHDIEKIAEIERDVWAREECLGEYVRCNCCGRIFSKNQIYAHLEEGIRKKTVGEIEDILSIKKVACPHCKVDTEYLSPRSEVLEEVLKRFSKKTHLALMRNGLGEVVGYMDGYVGSFEEIYDLSLAYHYDGIGINEIVTRIKNIIGKCLPEQMFLCSTACFLEEHASFKSMYGLLSTFFQTVPEDIGKLLGITELEFGGCIHGLCSTQGISALGFSEDPRLKQYTHTYLSDIFVREKFGLAYKDSFSLPYRDFFRQNVNLLRRVKNS